MTSVSDGQGPEQLRDFQLYYDVVSPQTRLYDNSGIEYGTGVFTIPLVPVVTASAIIIVRPAVLTLCEVQVYGSKFILVGLGLACQAKGQCCHTKISTLAKIFTKKTRKKVPSITRHYATKKDPFKYQCIWGRTS